MKIRLHVRVAVYHYISVSLFRDFLSLLNSDVSLRDGNNSVLDGVAGLLDPHVVLPGSPKVFIDGAGAGAPGGGGRPGEESVMEGLSWT